MASKTAVATKPKRSQEVATSSSDANLPAHLRGYKSEGRGVPTETKDFLIPMAKVLDAKSPEVTKGNPNRFAGAEPGDIFIKNAPVPLIKGDDGLVFQPCYRDDSVNEWLPRNKGGGGGGGFVAKHPADFLTDPNNAKLIWQRPHPENPEKKIWVMKSTGNHLIETRYYGGYMISDDAPPMPLVLPFSSTGHTVAKQWNMLIAQKRIGGAPADIWLVYYLVKTRNKTRADQSWFLFDVGDAGPEENGLPTTLWTPTLADRERGRILHEQLSSGEKKFSDDAGPADDEI
jgi:hypothetical protein